jgi:polar amino acid transport system substrate-binding protein
MTQGTSGLEIAGRLTDITDKRLAQIHADALARADKMISLGILVSGMAHEINNPNNFIMLNGGIVAEAWQDIIPVLEAHYQAHGDFPMAGINYSVMRDDLPKLMVGIQEGAVRIKRIIDDLTRFSRMEPPDLSQKVDINKVVAAAVSLLGSLIKRSPGCLQVHYDESIPCVYGSSQRIEQVIINLIQNACQALRETSLGVKVTTVRPKDWSGVIIRVEDDGCGISQEHLQHITDPFFTTKRVSGGVGLGLSVSSEIVREHGGELTFSSVFGKGTVATVTLPIKPVSA